jgi:hypothetical protein
MTNQEFTGQHFTGDALARAMFALMNAIATEDARIEALPAHVEEVDGDFENVDDSISDAQWEELEFKFRTK